MRFFNKRLRPLSLLSLLSCNAFYQVLLMSSGIETKAFRETQNRIFYSAIALSGTVYFPNLYEVIAC